VSESHPQELQIIQAFSTVTVPDRILRDSNVKELIRSMIDEQDKVQNNARNLDKARQEKKDGNIIGNWWNDRGDNVQEAQLDLSKSIGQLTQKSSQLLVVNTAISKVLSDQQNILLMQQDLLKQQTTRLEEQNEKILAHQLQLAAQQKAINAANEGLLTAKGVTQEQAKKLVGCVVRVEQAEKKIDGANTELRIAVEHRLDTALAQYGESVASLDGKVAGQLDVHLGGVQALLDGATTQVAHDLATALANIGQVQVRFDAAATQVARDVADGLARIEAQFDVVVTEVKHDLEAALAGIGQAQDAHARAVDETLSAQALHVRDELAQASERHVDLCAALTGQVHAQMDAQEKRNIASVEDATRWRTEASDRLDKAQKNAARATEQQAAALWLALEQADSKLASAGQLQRDALKSHEQTVDAKLAHLDTALAGNHAAMDTLATQLAHLQTKGHQFARVYRLTTCGVAGLAVLSLGWQLALHFA